ncbi:hypothetical protein [Stutzerimonas stutzeri]|jgi:DNA-binding transcriptional ArsR family regulator|uniref:hypothetical protein n=1 Tax=Stutzerimonas stutzeri TaxID=316 RepID=UPI0003984981|nr:hypothetical protein [Stutzerimonas stutzeri]EQM74119.1 hypothetical protein L686_21185 [Stutzerimonas stutzeri MF28]
MGTLQNLPSERVEAKTVAIVPCGLDLRFFVDVETGEILNPTEQMQKKRPKRDLRKSAYVGVTTPWPASARDEDELCRAVEPFDWWKDQLMVSANNMLQLLNVGLSEKAVRIFHHLALAISGRNVWFGSVVRLTESLGIPQRTVERALTELEQWQLIERKHQGRHWPLKVYLHPWYAWRGDTLIRKQALKKWALKHAKFGG